MPNKGTFMDFNRAFETVNKEQLLCEMVNTGLAGTIIKWFSSFMQDISTPEPTMSSHIDEKQTMLYHRGGFWEHFCKRLKKCAIQMSVVE